MTFFQWRKTIHKEWNLIYLFLWYLMLLRRKKNIFFRKLYLIFCLQIRLYYILFMLLVKKHKKNLKLTKKNVKMLRHFYATIIWNIFLKKAILLRHRNHKHIMFISLTIFFFFLEFKRFRKLYTKTITSL